MGWLVKALCASVAVLLARPALAQPEVAPDEPAVRTEAPTESLTNDALGRPASLRARALVLQDRAVDRRVAEQRAGDDATDEQRAAWAAAELVETRALDRIVTILANLEARPELLDANQAVRRESAREVREALQSPALGESVVLASALARLEADDAAYEVLLKQLRSREGPLGAADAAPHLEALDDPAAAPGAIERLGLLLPSLGPSDAVTVDDALGQWSREPRLPDLTEPLEPRVAEVLVALAVVRAEAIPGGFAGARAAADAVVAHLQGWPVHREDRTEQAERAQIEAAASQQAAEQAMDAAVRALLEQVARAQARRAEELAEPLFDPDAEPAPLTAAQVDEVDREITEMRSLWGWLRNLRNPEVDAVTPATRYESLLTEMNRLREREVDRQSAAEQLRTAVRTAESIREQESRRSAAAEENLESLPAEARAEVREGVRAWRAANDAWVDHLRERLDAARPRGWVERVQRLGRIKHRLIPDLPSSTFRKTLLTDLGDELAFVEPSMRYYERNRRAMFLDQVGGLLRDGNALFQLVNGSLLAVLLALLWAYGRSRASSLALSIAMRIRQGRPDLRVSDVRTLRDPLSRTIRNVVDLSFGPLLLINLDAVPELELFIRLYLYVALYRVVIALYDLLFVPADQARPALLVLRREGFGLLRRTVRAFALTVVLLLFVEWVVGDLLGLGTLLWLTDTVFWAWILVLGTWTLIAWEPLLRSRLRRRFTDPRGPARWLLPEHGSVLFVLPRALGQLVLLSGVLLAEGLHRFAAEGTTASTVYNLFNRAVLRDDASPDRPLDPEQRAAICEGPTPARHLVQREELAEVGRVLVRWRQTHQRGLVAVVGDRGAGKRTAMNELAESLTSSGMTVRRAALTEPVRSEKALAAWLGVAFAIRGEAQTIEEMVEAVQSVEPSAILIEGIHHTFLRRVGGLTTLQTLLYVLNASSAHHFYVCSVHGPAWDYFEAPGSLVDCGVFQTVVRLKPLDSQALRRITLGRAGDVGLRVDFSSLRVGSLGSDRDLEADRATAMYYRLLAEASRGNPGAALRRFADSLVRTDDRSVVQVTLREVLELETLPDELGETSLFVLVALDLHDALTLEDLVTVTHLPRHLVRASVRDLVSRGWVIRSAEHLRLCDEKRIVVQRSLRRRHFLHLGPDG